VSQGSGNQEDDVLRHALKEGGSRAVHTLIMWGIVILALVLGGVGSIYYVKYKISAVVSAATDAASQKAQEVGAVVQNAGTQVIEVAKKTGEGVGEKAHDVADGLATQVKERLADAKARLAPGADTTSVAPCAEAPSWQFWKRSEPCAPVSAPTP
jgi:hypothetical protein